MILDDRIMREAGCDAATDVTALFVLVWTV